MFSRDVVINQLSTADFGNYTCSASIDDPYLVSGDISYETVLVFVETGNFCVYIDYLFVKWLFP